MINKKVNTQKRKLPHYEKMPSSITKEQAKKDYSYVWQKMDELVPNLNSEEKRRVIEIIASSCKSCFQDETGCQCWNDE